MAFARGFSAKVLGAWILLIVCATLYSYTWDILIDFRLQFCLLRPTLTYPRPFYYWALVSNFIMRCLWVLTISPAFQLNQFWQGSR